jgi:hypothetical protein
LNSKQLDHVLRAAAAITGEKLFVVLGSQAMLLQFPRLPEELTQPVDVDVYPKSRPKLAEVIAGAIGKDSPFHSIFGYYAHCFGPKKAGLPKDWESRAISYAIAGTEAAAIAPDIHDLAVAMLMAGGRREMDWLQFAIETALLDAARAASLLPETGANAAALTLARIRLERFASRRTFA